MFPVFDVEMLRDDLAQHLRWAGKAAAVVLPKQPAGPAGGFPDGVGEDNGGDSARLILFLKKRPAP